MRHESDGHIRKVILQRAEVELLEAGLDIGVFSEIVQLLLEVLVDPVRASATVLNKDPSASTTHSSAGM